MANCRVSALQETGLYDLIINNNAFGIFDVDNENGPWYFTSYFVLLSLCSQQWNVQCEIKLRRVAYTTQADDNIIVNRYGRRAIVNCYGHSVAIFQKSAN